MINWWLLRCWCQVDFIGYSLLTEQKAAMLCNFTDKLKFLVFDNVGWNRHQIAPNIFLLVKRTRTLQVIDAGGAAVEAMTFATIVAAIQFSVATIASLPHMFQQHGAHMQHAQSLGASFLIAPEIGESLINLSSSQTCVNQKQAENSH